MKLFKNKLAVTIIVLSVTFLVLIGYSAKRNKVSFLENGLGVTLNSVNGVFYNLNTKVKNLVDFFVNFSDVKEENKELRKKNIELKANLEEYSNLYEENKELRSILDLQKQSDKYKYVGCEIIQKGGGNYLNEFVINKGKKDGIEKQLIVIGNEGLVGQIVSVSNNWSIMQIVSNENMAVRCTIDSTNENVGIVKGFNDSNKQLAKVYYLPLDSKVKVGDSISTSGLGGFYPKGIRIGEVIDIEEDKGKVMKNAVIKPYVNLNKLEEVFVVVPKHKINIEN